MRTRSSLRYAARLSLLSFIALGLHTVRAGSATWKLDPATGDWNTATNWSPETVPNGPTDVATFDASNTIALTFSNTDQVNSIVFNPGASAYTIMVGTGINDRTVTISGTGIVNNSGLMQNFAVTPRPSYDIIFTGTATAGTMTTFTNLPGDNPNHRITPGEQFMDNTSADHATFITDGSISGSTFHGQVQFLDDSTAGDATCINNPGASSGGITAFLDSSNAGNGTFICNGGTATLPIGGVVQFLGTSDADKGVFTANGTDAPGATGGLIDVEASAGSGTFIANGGQVAGGHILFGGLASSGGSARVELFGNGQLDISFANQNLVTTIGSLEGDGLVFLGSQNLTIGGNSLSTTFAGIIADGGLFGGLAGSLTLASDATLTLTGANTYTGPTTVNSGTLVVSNTTGSATGKAALRVNAGILGGGGIVSGLVTIGTGSGTGAFLVPAHGTNKQAGLTIAKSITFNADAAYTCTFKAKNNTLRNDSITAAGVTIRTGANVDISGQVQRQLSQGLVLTLISNTSAAPIKGRFDNLADGAIITVDGNNFQASYEGGDGNDLTLTVVL